MKALVISRSNAILYIVDVPDDIREIEIAGTVTIDGAPVNRRTYKISRSKYNFKCAARMDLDFLVGRRYKGFEFFFEIKS
ncbi:hypothetical protein [Pseudomonas aeruginosa]|uniref:hypothetical protein n=1 Tax=Pseudomonas aeruginosa TaxID=287 RepID=UPI000F7DD2E2|nr:hypothetical protein [Pseudomonas aeruginosa]RTB44140.1 hypothetical protein EJ655_08360 [Pseudomonas aeruginosa]